MAIAARGIDSYRQTEIQSRSPLELVVMLYDGALRFTADAREAMVRRDIRTRQQNLSNHIKHELKDSISHVCRCTRESLQQFKVRRQRRYSSECRPGGSTAKQ